MTEPLRNYDDDYDRDARDRETELAYARRGIGPWVAGLLGAIMIGAAIWILLVALA